MNNKRIYGLFFMMIALVILVGQLFADVFNSLNVALWTIIFGFFLVRGLVKLSWWMISISTYLLVNMYNDIYNFLPFSAFMLLIILVIFCIGFSMFFSKSSFVEVKVIKKSDKNYEKNIFNSTTKYINDKQLEKFTYSASFSEVKLYFDNADLKQDSAIFDIKVHFSEMTLYVPKNWMIVNNMKVFAGELNQKTADYPTDKTVYLKGNVSFGELKIIYI